MVCAHTIDATKLLLGEGGGMRGGGSNFVALPTLAEGGGGGILWHCRRWREEGGGRVVALPTLIFPIIYFSVFGRFGTSMQP